MSHGDILLCLELCAAMECTWIGVPVSTILFLDGSPIIICNDRESELNRKCPWAVHISTGQEVGGQHSGYHSILYYLLLDSSCHKYCDLIS